MLKMLKLQENFWAHVKVAREFWAVPLPLELPKFWAHVRGILGSPIAPGTAQILGNKWNLKFGCSVQAKLPVTRRFGCSVASLKALKKNLGLPKNTPLNQ